mmetsp:Transcript_19942/g.50304  ORF Transcript_19942/g.50304 Transcript_19942/m.50304 type:complete len:94 (-) Transcript_19942:4-285(-)
MKASEELLFSSAGFEIEASPEHWTTERESSWELVCSSLATVVSGYSVAPASSRVWREYPLFRMNVNAFTYFNLIMGRYGSDRLGLSLWKKIVT